MENNIAYTSQEEYKRTLSNQSADVESIPGNEHVPRGVPHPRIIDSLQDSLNELTVIWWRETYHVRNELLIFQNILKFSDLSSTHMTFEIPC